MYVFVASELVEAQNIHTMRLPPRGLYLGRVRDGEKITSPGGRLTKIFRGFIYVKRNTWFFLYTTA